MKNNMTGIDKIILCDNKVKNADIAIVTARLFNEVMVQKNELKRLDYFFTIHKFTKWENSKIKQRGDIFCR